MNDVPHYYGIDPGSDEWKDIEWFRFLTGISDLEYGGFKDCSPISEIALHKDLYKKVIKLSLDGSAGLFDTNCEAMGRLDYCHWYEMVPLERPADHMDPEDITSFIHGLVTKQDIRRNVPVTFQLSFEIPDLGYPDICKNAIMDLLADDLKNGRASWSVYGELIILHDLQARHLADRSYAAQVCKEYIGRVREAWLIKEEGHLRQQLYNMKQDIACLHRSYNELARRLEKRQ